PGLHDLYDRMISQIYKMEDADDVYLCKRVLAVVAIAYRPITLDELTSFIEPPSGIDNDVGTMEYFIGLCGSFLVIREQTIYFAHQSAKDFLFKKELDMTFPSGIEDVHHSIFSQSLRLMSKT